MPNNKQGVVKSTQSYNAGESIIWYNSKGPFGITVKNLKIFHIQELTLNK